MSGKRVRLLATSLALASFPALANDAGLPGNAPVPFARPYAAVGAGIDNTATGAVARQFSQATQAPRAGGSIAQLKGGLDALAAGDIGRARKMRAAMPSGSLDEQILAWAIALSGDRSVPSGEIAAAGQELAGWPGMLALRRNSERALYEESPAPRAVLQAFGNSKPQTYKGAVILARAHLALGNRDAARAAIVPFWRKEKLDAQDEVAAIREFGRIIPAAEHRRRMEQMLYEDRVNSAQRVAKLAGAESLANAWGAVIRRDKNAARLLDAVPKGQRGAGYIYAKAKHLRWAEKYRDAAKVMLAAPTDAASLVDPDAWWIERRVLSRELLDIGDPKTAYRLAAAHAAESPAMAADAEFHAGWYALRALNDPATASRHFSRIAAVADGAISRSRAYYWLGRAAEAGGPGSARDYYAQAARYGTAFYGQLAAAKLGRNGISADYPAPSPQDRLAFPRRAAVQAIQRLEAAGHPKKADLLYRDLARELTSPGELALLAVMAEKRGDHYLALRIGKIAAARGLDIGALSHPVGAIPSSAKLSDAGMALAYAIARQESEFNPTAVSKAGARGLLQLMPGTAQSLAKRAGLGYSQSKLTSDAAYNATLGSAYLSDQLARFDGSYVLTFAGYNAGPSRATEWVKRYGDPRGKNIDTIVDWIERIPYAETRNYVQRVMENYQVYKMRLSGRFDITADLINGR